MPGTEDRVENKENYTVVGKISWDEEGKEQYLSETVNSAVEHYYLTHLEMAQIIPVLDICTSVEFVPVLYWSGLLD